jgi:hypothetical protein
MCRCADAPKLAPQVVRGGFGVEVTPLGRCNQEKVGLSEATESSIFSSLTLNRKQSEKVLAMLQLLLLWSKS